MGNLTCDVIAGSPPRPGGTVYHSARAYARLGTDATVTASCAAADRATLLPALEALGLPLSWRPSSRTTAYAFHYEGDHRVMRQDAIGDPWTPEQALAAAGEAEWVHVGALTRTDFPAETLAALAADGRTLLVDAQGLVRRPTLGPLQCDGDVGDALGHVTLLKLDEEEAIALTGSLDPARIGRLGVPEAIVTLGSRGSFVVTAAGVEHVEPGPTEGRVDPTGAGDMYAAAYLDARARGAVPGEAARSASALVAELIDESRGPA